MEKSSAENTDFERAIRAGQAVLNNRDSTLNPAEQAMLAMIPKEDRLAAIVFVRWCENKKWKGGIQGKLIAKSAFIEAFRLAKEIYAPDKDERPGGRVGGQIIV
jgi:hypothetical protein